ncbi:hypothetical protein Tco_0603080 [Tanacetum coccineum]
MLTMNSLIPENATSQRSIPHTHLLLVREKMRILILEEIFPFPRSSIICSLMIRRNAFSGMARFNEVTSHRVQDAKGDVDFTEFPM